MTDDGEWVTMRGTHVFIKKGQSPEDALAETTGKKVEEKKTTEKKEEKPKEKSTLEKSVEHVKKNPIPEKSDKKNFKEAKKRYKKTVKTLEKLRKFKDSKNKPAFWKSDIKYYTELEGRHYRAMNKAKKFDMTESRSKSEVNDIEELNHDQKDPIEDTLKDLKADLQTTLGDGELLEVTDMLYYYASETKQLYEIDFDKYDAEKSVLDITKTSEVSDSDDPHEPRTDSINDSCPLLKKKKEEVQKMDEKEKNEDMYDIEKEDETVQDDSDPKDTISDTVPVKEDIKEEKIVPQIDMNSVKFELKDFIKETIKETMNDLTRDFKTRENKIKETEKNELVDLLLKEPYGYASEDLESLSITELESTKKMFEKSKMYKDFKSTQPAEITEEIDKQLFNDTVEMKGDDPWAAFNNGYDFGEGEVAKK